MLDVHSRHLRLVTDERHHFDEDDYAYADGFYARRQIEKFNRASHSDALPEMQILPFAEHIQTDPLTVLRSIDRADFFYSICIFSALAFVAGAVLAMGAK